MKRYITVLLITLVQLSVFAQTNVKGTLSENTKWTIKESPYFVTGNVGVPDGVTLTIDPGVVINFNTIYQIIVQGSLVLNGTLKDPIVLNGNMTGAAMILFQKTNLSNSKINYLTVTGPKNGIEFRDFDNLKNTGRLVINRLKITNSCIAALGTNIEAVVEINNSDFTNSNINNANKDEAIIINNSKITGGQITAQSSVQSITLFEDTCYKTIFNFASYGMLQADACLFYNVKFGPTNSGSILNLKSSWLYNSAINMWNNEVNMSNCIVRFDSDYKETYCVRIARGLISSSEFIGNSNRTAIDRGYSYSYSKFKVVDCEFSGFKNYLRVREWAPGNDTSVFINRCNFSDAISDSAIINLSKYNINASNNWWGSDSEALIKNSIHDFWDDIIYGKVNYSGFSSGPIENTGLLKINSVSVMSGEANAIRPIRIVTSTNLPGNGKRVFKTHYLFHDTLFLELCYYQGIGLAITAVSDTFDIGYLAFGNHPLVCKVSLSSSSVDCSLLKTTIATSNVQVNMPANNLYGVSSMPVAPLYGDHIKIATAFYLPNIGYKLGKSQFIRNDTVFLELRYYAEGSSQKTYCDTFDLGYPTYGNYTVLLSLGLSLSPNFDASAEKAVFKSILSVRLADIQNYKVTNFPQYPAAGDDVIFNTEVRVNPYGKLLSENYHISKDTIYLEQCFYAGFGNKIETINRTVNIGKLQNKTYLIRFIAHLSPDSNICKSVTKGYYDKYMFVAKALGLNLLSGGEISISPNPFNDQVSIKGKDVKLLEIFDLRGQLIKTINNPNENLINDLSLLNPGLFIFQVTSTQGTVIRKKMVKN